MTADPISLYLDELEAWNERINLTTVPVAERRTRHVGESLALLALLDPAPGTSLVDLGSGAGVPGIPIAIERPDITVTLIEADKRKAGFLIHVSGLLGLNNTVVLAERAEVTGHSAGQRGSHDLVVSRATAALPVLCELALPLLRVGGRLVAMVGDSADIEAAVAAATACGGDAPRVMTHGIVSVMKVSATPGEYPRRTGVPQRRPLG